MSDTNQRLCPDCEEGIVPHYRPGWAWCQCCGWVGPRSECHFAVDLDAKPEAPRPAPEAPPQEPPVRRARTSDATNDIENAMIAWHTYACDGFNADYMKETEKALIRARTWLTQVAADQRQLHAALLACQAMAAVDDYADVDAVPKARKLAMDAIAEGEVRS